MNQGCYKYKAEIAVQVYDLKLHQLYDWQIYS